MGRCLCISTLILALLCARREAEPAVLPRQRGAARRSLRSHLEVAGLMTPGEAAIGAPGKTGQEVTLHGGKRSEQADDSEQALKHPES
jgi:hypothetical protein